MKQHGGTYLILLIALALMSLASAMSLSAGHSLALRDKEIEFLFIGQQFRAALLSYEQHLQWVHVPSHRNCSSFLWMIAVQCHVVIYVADSSIHSPDATNGVC